MKHEKLVRDKIPDEIRTRGATCETRTLIGMEYSEALRSKLIEESFEVKSAITRTQLIEELADCQAVINAICLYWNIHHIELNEAVLAKQRAKGGFANGVYLIESQEPKPKADEGVDAWFD